MTRHAQKTVAQTDLQDNDPQARFIRNLERYIADEQKKDVLHKHQKTIFEDTRQFLLGGGRRGFIEAPTGTGKTVLFVSLAEALSYGDDTPPKILDVAPTIDLLHQTRGGNDDDKGFAGFAPDMEVGMLYGATPERKRKERKQVMITTYATMSKLAHPSRQRFDTTMQLNGLNEFDVILLDESHRALGARRKAAIDGVDQSKLIIGFTATPDFNEHRRLDQMLPTEIHRLDLKEAITLQMLSPAIPVSVAAPGVQLRHLTVGGSGGEYDRTSLRELIYDERRNQLIVDLACQSIAAGNSPIISCIPGDEMTHPQIVADMIASKTITDKTGTIRPVRAASIVGSMPAAERQRIYARFESGEVDVLTYIDILTEGWDSQRANILLNARPTRSPLAARQRLGRVLRQKTDGRPAYVLDIIDVLSADSAPPVTMADIFEQNSVTSGSAIGDIDSRQISDVDDFLLVMKRDFAFVPIVYNNHTRHVAMLAQLEKVRNGRVTIQQNGKIRHFSTTDRIMKRMNVDTLALRELTRRGLNPHEAQMQSTRILTYDEQEVNELLHSLPNGTSVGNYLTWQKQQYMGVEDVLALIHTKYSNSHVTYQTIESLLRDGEITDPKLYFTKHLRGITHRIVPMYTARTMMSMDTVQRAVAKLAD